MKYFFLILCLCQAVLALDVQDEHFKKFQSLTLVRKADLLMRVNKDKNYSKKTLSYLKKTLQEEILKPYKTDKFSSSTFRRFLNPIFSTQENISEILSHYWHERNYSPKEKFKFIFDRQTIEELLKAAQHFVIHKKEEKDENHPLDRICVESPADLFEFDGIKVTVFNCLLGLLISLEKYSKYERFNYMVTQQQNIDRTYELLSNVFDKIYLSSRSLKAKL